MPYQPRIGVVREKTISFRLADSEIDRVNSAAKSEGKSRSDYLRDTVRADLERKGI